MHALYKLHHTPGIKGPYVRLKIAGSLVSSTGQRTYQLMRIYISTELCYPNQIRKQSTRKSIMDRRKTMPAQRKGKQKKKQSKACHQARNRAKLLCTSTDLVARYHQVLVSIRTEYGSRSGLLADESLNLQALSAAQNEPRN